jgi:hypothetical protein
VQAELAGVPNVGTNVFASAAAMDKDAAKRLLRHAIGEFCTHRKGPGVRRRSFPQVDVGARKELDTTLFHTRRSGLGQSSSHSTKLSGITLMPAWTNGMNTEGTQALNAWAFWGTEERHPDVPGRRAVHIEIALRLNFRHAASEIVVWAVSDQTTTCFDRLKVWIGRIVSLNRRRLLSRTSSKGV